jgi:type I restriction enzyme R subunit
LTDRNDLDGQLFRTFKRSGYPVLAKQAKSIRSLKEHLKQATSELIFTTIQKFETEREKLSDKNNIIVIADEAHRSQYAHYAANVRDSIPNASFMGITGTPVSLHNRDTRLVFGDYISEYKINQAVSDGATVPIYYESRLAKLKLVNYFLDEEYEKIMEGEEFEYKENYKRKFVRLEQAIGSPNRLKKISQDIIYHFNNRGLVGKAMIVTISRRVAVELYKIISKEFKPEEIAVVISKPEDFKNSIQREKDNKELERRFKNPNDPLKIVIVCDMWLTGFDVPSLHTMYLDKPLKNHTLMQAIARVNRVYKDKPGGLIVDYIGIADNLKKALSIYSSNIQKEAMIPLESVIEKMKEKFDVVKKMLTGIDFSGWKELSHLDRTRLFQQAVNYVITNPGSGLADEERKKDFLKESEILFKLFALVMPHHEASQIRNEVEFLQTVKSSIKKRIMVGTIGLKNGVESTIRDLISKSIEAEKVIDIFEMQGKGKVEVSIFNEKFLEEAAKMRYKNIAVEVLKKLLNDEIRIRMRKNIIRYKTLQELLEKIIEDYEKNIKNSASTLERLIRLAKKIKETEEKNVINGLNEEEVAFFDILSVHKNNRDELKNISKDLVKTIRSNLTVDWTHNEIIKPRIRANLSLLLLQKGFSPKELPKILESIMQQANLLYRDYSPK